MTGSRARDRVADRAPKRRGLNGLAEAAQRLWDRDGAEVVGDRQQERLLPVKPQPRVIGATGRTMPVAAGVEGEALRSAAWAGMNEQKAAVFTEISTRSILGAADGTVHHTLARYSPQIFRLFRL